MIVVDNNSNVVGFGVKIERVNEQNEENLIKVWTDDEKYYYIGTIDRDDYVIYNVDVPNNNKFWKYVDGEFIEVTYDDDII